MNKGHLKLLVIAISCLLLAGIFLTGCNSTKTQAVDPAKTTTSTPPVAETPESTTKSVELTLYFPNSQATGLIAVKRTVKVTNQEMIQAMFRELAVPPSGLEKLLPQGSRLLNASVNSEGIATIDLSQEFQKNFSGGSAEEQLTLYSIVNTLTTLSNVQSVQFLLEGQKHPGILGHIDTSEPIKRNEGLILKTS